jgi:hypothetical protein
VSADRLIRSLITLCVRFRAVLIAFGVLVCAMGEINLVVKGLVQQLTALAFEVRAARVPAPQPSWGAQPVSLPASLAADVAACCCQTALLAALEQL